MSTKKKMGAGREHGVALVKALPYSHPRWVVAISFIVGAGAAFLLPQAHFDYNPLNLYNKHSESVVTMKELFGKGEAPPWTISVMAKDRKQAEDIAKKLSALKEVKMALTIFDFVPADQKEKLEIISDMGLFVPQGTGKTKVKSLSYRQDILALKKLEKSLINVQSGPLAGAAERLYRSTRKFEALLVSEESGRRAFAELERGMLSNLPLLFQRLTTVLQASPVREADLPADLARQYIGVDGRYRVQVFPSGDLMNRAVLARFVKAVRAVAPDATDAPVTIYESGRAVSSSFMNASLYALVAIVLFLLLELKSLKATLLILMPLFFAIVLTAASSVLLAIPFNFANVVVIPLMLGSGVHAGILFVLRYGEKGGGNDNILTTSTARSILFSSLTTMASTGSLAFSSHQGIASIGILLSLCFTFLTFSTLILLPAMLELLRPERRKI
jgi:hopanoid biosynthesis associated RND transporter like protein HpnN